MVDGQDIEKTVNMAKQSSDKKLKLSVDENEKTQHCSECHTKLLVQEFQDFYQE